MELDDQEIGRQQSARTESNKVEPQEQNYRGSFIGKLDFNHTLHNTSEVIGGLAVANLVLSTKISIFGFRF